MVVADLKKLYRYPATADPIRVSLEKQFYLRHNILYNNICACVFAQLDTSIPTIKIYLHNIFSLICGFHVFLDN